MKLLIDDANIMDIRRLYENYPVRGVTTNPSILTKAKKDPYKVLKEIRDFIGEEEDLHVQVVSSSIEGMIQDAIHICELLGNMTYIKVPASQKGIAAMKSIVAQNMRVTGTAIYTPMQAYLAAEAGASWVAPYINRIDNMGFDGVSVAKQIQDIFENNGLPCKVLAASFKNSQQVLELAQYGIGASTAAPSIIDNFINNAAIDAAIQVFEKDWENLTQKKAF